MQLNAKVEENLADVEEVNVYLAVRNLWTKWNSSFFHIGCWLSLSLSLEYYAVRVAAWD